MILSDLVRINETSFYSLIWHWFYARFCHPPYPGVPWWASNSRTWSLSTINAREKMRRVTKQVWTRLERTDWGSKITLTIVHFFFVIEACRLLVSLLICFCVCLLIWKRISDALLNSSYLMSTYQMFPLQGQLQRNVVPLLKVRITDYSRKSQEKQSTWSFLKFLFSICFRQNDDFHFDY